MKRLRYVFTDIFEHCDDNKNGVLDYEEIKQLLDYCYKEYDELAAREESEKPSRPEEHVILSLFCDHLGDGAEDGIGVETFLNIISDILDCKVINAILENRTMRKHQQVNHK
jgi:hypothetical protein